MLRILDLLAKTGSYTRAADQLGLTQSGVSHAMRAWEEALGAPLAKRSGRIFELTPVGEAVLRQARVALEHIEAIAGLADRKPVSGRVRLGTVASAAIALVPHALDALRRLHPGISVELIEGTDTEVGEWFRHGIVDVGIAMDTLGPTANVLRSTEMIAVIPRHHALASAKAISPGELAASPFVMSASGCEDSILAHARAAGATLDVALRIRDTRAILAAVRSGLGVTVLPRLAIDAAPDGLICRALHPPLTRDLHVAVAEPSFEAAQALINELSAVP
jgi:DNA-binding transcriptional LysR family regulator